MSIENLIRLREKESRKVIGLMSGTSCDGIDACLVKITGNGMSTEVDIIGFETFPYNDEIRKLIFKTSCKETGTVDKICQLNFTLGKLFADAVTQIAEKMSIPLSEIDIIGSHGQTIYHISSLKEQNDKEVRSTLQIGEASVIAQETGVTTVADFRTRDIAADGGGAPLVPYSDFILFGRDGIGRVIQNIGGISNVTILYAGGNIEEIIAFDNGPGNMIIDRFAEIITDGRLKYDKNGELASKGRLNQDLLDRLCTHPYLSKPPPKTTGREDFGIQFSDDLFKRLKQDNMDIHNAIATVTAFTAKTISDSYRKFIHPSHKISEIIISGGGVHNPVLLQFLENYLGNVSIKKIDDLGIPSDAKEAVAFAILANETICGNPGNVPSVTGAKESVVLGKIIPGK
ncbi:anhydro-N-acetylmuramic acid kinase [Candidatus Scalindua japonica]|uniref:Anhydro-N-acetylmuramic acid kinase n=1 Tax=Candidatus Scalindua japonica TaxID=1284222 RepID=A0A286U1F1_9BACT|nr:anhydro-N-acetylmuramic acid kinase [Candidatus Scalindua japonica]GAX61901.1 anhydro-N-acetylmuramic acid kinase [Candidatus Scalindua japonica]